MEKQGFEEKEELKSRLESTMEEKFKLEKVSKYIFSHQVLLFSLLSLPHWRVYFYERLHFIYGRYSRIQGAIFYLSCYTCV